MGKKFEILEKLENHPVSQLGLSPTVDLLPYGSHLKALYFTVRNKIFEDEIEKLEDEKLLQMMQDEKFIHLLEQVNDACLRSKEIEKAKLFTKFFRTIVDKGEFSENDSSEIEEFIYLFSTFSYREILALHKIREFTSQNPQIINDVESFLDLETGKYTQNWNTVLNFLENKLGVKNIESFLSRLENSKLIISAKSSEGIYISTNSFENIYDLSSDLDDYLNECLSAVN